MPPSRQAENPSPTSWAARFTTALLCLVLGATLYVYPTSLNPGLPILGSAALSFFVGCWRLARGSGPYYHWGMDLSVILAVWMTVSCADALDAYLSQRSLATFIGAVGFLWAVQCGVKSSRDWRLMAHGFVFFGVLTCLFAWPQAIRVALASGSIPPLKGTFVNPDTFSVVPLLALALAPALLEKASSRMGLFVCAQMLILFLSIVASGCRASLLGYAVGFGVALTVLLGNRNPKHLKKVKVLLVLPLGLILLALPLSNLGLHVSDKYVAVLTGEAAARQATRIEVATYGWRAVLNHPLLGAGPGCFGAAFQSVRPAGHDELYINIAHNDPLEIAVELGIPGAMLWFILVISSINKCYKLLLDGRRPVAAASILSALVAIAVYSLFNFVMAERPILWVHFWILGIAFSFPSSRLIYKESKIARYVACLVLLCLSGWSFVFGYRAFRADAYLVQSQILARQLQLEQAMRKLEAAITLQPQRSGLYLQLAELEKTWSAFYPGHESQARRLALLEKARTSSPANLGVFFALSELSVEMGDLEKGVSYLESAQKLTPYHRTVREKRIALAIRRGDVEKALTLLLTQEPTKKRDEQIVTLLLALKSEHGEEVDEAIRQVLQGAQRDRSLGIIEKVLKQCQMHEAWEQGLSWAALAAKSVPDDLCWQVRWADFAEKTVSRVSVKEILDQAMSGAEASRDQCYEALLKKWVDLYVGQGLRARADQRLKEDLKEDERLVQARLLLGQSLFEQGYPEQAILLLREGLEHDSHSAPLLHQIALFYEKSGNRDLALNYYREAADINPKDKNLKAKVQQLRKARR